MEKISLCVFGVNGVGKTTLLDAVSGLLTEPITMARGSTILKETLNVASYEALESMSAAEKKQALMEGMASLVMNAATAVTIVDTHLVVPIRASGRMTAEDMWDDRMLEIFQGFVYISAAAPLVAERRRADTGRSLRAAAAIPQLCAEDLRLNESRWDDISARINRKKVVMNDQTVLVGATKLAGFLQSLRT